MLLAYFYGEEKIDVYFVQIKPKARNQDSFVVMLSLSGLL